MEKKRFKYKPSAVDQMIMFIILLAVGTFAALIYFDATNKLPSNGNNSSAEVQRLQEAERELREEINRARSEQ